MQRAPLTATTCHPSPAAAQSGLTWNPQLLSLVSKDPGEISSLVDVCVFSCILVSKAFECCKICSFFASLDALAPSAGEDTVAPSAGEDAVAPLAGEDTVAPSAGEGAVSLQEEAVLSHWLLMYRILSKLAWKRLTASCFF